MKHFFTPIVCAVLLGVGSSFITIKYNQGETTQWRKNIERRFIALEVILSAVQVNQIQLATTRQQHIGTTQRLDKVESDIATLLADNYTNAHAQKDMEVIMREIRFRHGEGN